jgi:hypothetical protein
MWENVITLYKNYAGTGMLAGLFLVALLYLFVTEKNKITRILFVYMPAMLLVLYFCPLFAAIVYAFVGEEIYYRLLWLLPVVPVLAYAAVKLLTSMKTEKTWKKAVTGAALVGIVITSGSLVYQSPYFSRAQNPYHVPQEVVEICDSIRVEGREVVAVFPTELIPYVRQYSAYIWMPYGREILVERWNFQNELFDLMNQEVLDVDLIAQSAHEKGCHYVIISKEKMLNGSFEDYQYELFDEVEHYLIYADTTLYRGL